MPGLAGLRIVITRAPHQAEELAHPLRDAGAEPILVPVIDIAPPDDPGPLREAAAELDSFDWIIFTSVNAVKAFAAELPVPRTGNHPHVAVIGTATCAAAEKAGFPVALRPDKYFAESLVSAFAAGSLNGKRILIPSAAVTRDVVPSELRKFGAEVTIVEAYRNVIPPAAAERVQQVFSSHLPDWVTFASSSAVNNLVALAGTGPLKFIQIASIGPLTSDAVRRHGLAVNVEANVQTTQGLVAALLAASARNV